MRCIQLTSPEEQIRQLTDKLRKFTDFALAHEDWEADVLDDHSPWFDQMPEELTDSFDEVQRLRNLAMML